MPLLFEIYDGGRRLTSYRVRGAYAVGPESIPLPGRVSFMEGLLRVEAGDDGLDSLGHHGGGDPGDEAGAYTGLAASAAAVGVSLLWDAGSAGDLMLETTRLPPRSESEPYILNVELARHRLMRLVQKQEDWNLWELPPAAAAVGAARRAQAMFAEALGMLHDRAAASVKADEALAAAIHAGEQLARVHAELLLNRRRRTGLPRTLVGICADASEDAPRSAAYRTHLTRNFDCVTVPIPWRQMQPEEDTFDTEGIDTAVEMVGRAKLPTVAGPLIDLGEGNAPDWLFLYENNFEALRDFAFAYVRAAVTRYRRIVKLWNVVAGLHACGSFGITFEQMIELTRLLVGQVKAVSPTAKTLVTIQQPFGEYLSGPPGASSAVPPMLYAEMVAQSGVQVDGFGVEIVMGRPGKGRYVRDLFQISAMLDRFAPLNKPVFVTAVACPDSHASPTDEGGRWFRKWDRELQAQWLRDVYSLCMSKPFVESVAWADLVDGKRTVLPGAGLFDDLLQPKASAVALRDLRNAARPFLRGVRSSAAPAAPAGA